jgi:hypothetical protein
MQPQIVRTSRRSTAGRVYGLGVGVELEPINQMLLGVTYTGWQISYRLSNIRAPRATHGLPVDVGESLPLAFQLRAPASEGTLSERVLHHRLCVAVDMKFHRFSLKV